MLTEEIARGVSCWEISCREEGDTEGRDREGNKLLIEWL
jgi:hypothetical protein